MYLSSLYCLPSGFVVPVAKISAMTNSSRKFDGVYSDATVKSLAFAPCSALIWPVYSVTTGLLLPGSLYFALIFAVHRPGVTVAVSTFWFAVHSTVLSPLVSVPSALMSVALASTVGCETVIVTVTGLSSVSRVLGFLQPTSVAEKSIEAIPSSLIDTLSVFMTLLPISKSLLRFVTIYGRSEPFFASKSLVELLVSSQETPFAVRLRCTESE